MAGRGVDAACNAITYGRSESKCTSTGIYRIVDAQNRFNELIQRGRICSNLLLIIFFVVLLLFPPQT